MDITICQVAMILVATHVTIDNLVNYTCCANRQTFISTDKLARHVSRNLCMSDGMPDGVMQVHERVTAASPALRILSGHF